MHFITRFFLMIAVSLGVIQAGEIPGYIGEQSFRLSDDYELGNAMRRAEDAKIDVVQSERARNQVGEQLRGLENQQRAFKERMELLLKEADVAKGERQVLAAKLEELKKTPDVNAEAIAATQKEIELKDAYIADKNKQAGAVKIDSAPVNVRLDQVRNDFNVASRRAEEANHRMQTEGRRLNEYREELIVALKKINYDGGRVGQNDGVIDGADVSADLGSNRGNIDGNGDGLSKGTIDGQDRFYRRGSELGDREGSTRANKDGLRDGTNEGLVNGNKSAGASDGRSAGIRRADASNAAQVGTEQGKKAGLERAVGVGRNQGRAIGESETTKKLESGQLNSVNLNGPFAGSFERRVPSYPGDFNGRNFKPNINHSKELMRKAFADGYVFNYRQNMRYEFERRITTDYNYSYEQNFKVGYDSAAGRDYPAFFDKGRRDGDARAYSRDYPVAKDAAYQSTYNETVANPIKSSAEYKSSYTANELAAFNQRYEDIRQANYVAVEAQTYNENVAGLIEVYRQKRITEVTNIYNGNPVLEFVSSEMLDGGIKGVAMTDGVFQPGETTNHNVVIRNFGFKEASSVTVKLDNGASVKLPTIAARSVVTIKGAAQSSVNVGLNSVFKSNLSVVAPLATNDAVEGAHYDRLEGGVLKLADQKAIRITYPIALSGLSLESQLLKGAKNKLRIGLTNNSKREYKGELKVRLLANSQNAILTKEFSPATSLQTSATLSDAEVLVESEDDTYRDISISAKIEQNGVVIGELSQDLVIMAKAKFVDGGKLPTIVVNSDSQVNSLKDTLESLGGLKNVSVLDLSLPSLNSQVISQGLSQKVMLVVDDSNGSALATLNDFIGKSKSSTFILLDDSGAGVKNSLKLAALKDASKLSLNRRPVVFTNPHRASGVQKASAFMQGNPDTLAQDIVVAQNLALTAPELINELKVKVTAENFSTPNELLKIYSLKTLSEIMAINVAYDASGGIFTSDKKWVKMIEEDKTLFINQMKAASSGDVVVSKLPMILSAIAMRDTVSTAMSHAESISKDMTSKIKSKTNDVLDDMKDSYEKKLKKDFKELYNKAYANAPLHSPFIVKTE